MPEHLDCKSEHFW